MKPAAVTGLGAGNAHDGRFRNDTQGLGCSRATLLESVIDLRNDAAAGTGEARIVVCQEGGRRPTGTGGRLPHRDWIIRPTGT